MNQFIRKIYYSLPVNFRYSFRQMVYFPVDLFSNRPPLVPPKGMIFIGSGNYTKIGKDFFNYFKEYGGITPESAILDIGSGTGRMAVPFTEFLSINGHYEGFDIVKKGVDWCNQNISKAFPNFNFKHTPLKNDLYNLSTDKAASNFIFPYQNETFDFTFLTSVFTHMMPDDLENYIEEIHRVLKKEKKCFVTFFLLDDESEKSMNKNEGKKFSYPMENYSLMNKSVKEANVAYQKKYIYDLMAKNNFEIESFFRGNWSGLPTGKLNEHQDILIIKKV